MTIAISVENLSKAYRIGRQVESSSSLVGALLSLAAAPVRNFRQLASLDTFGKLREDESLYWALRDVSFEIKEGDVVGIIGRNGAGKSTLLKILSRITQPTTGRAVLRGRVSSLLEVGTGFHQELSGRENVYMNGTILGMKKREIDRKFAEIVEFSGIEKFLDTPVKRYSSGMKVRLAFAVAAHLEPEILIIDEVLAVGDFEFQRKCIGKMSEVANSGRTVLFVSHNAAAVESLCSRAVLLENGQIAFDGETRAALKRFQHAGEGAGDVTRDLTNHPGRLKSESPIMQSVTLRNAEGVAAHSFDMGKTLIVEVAYRGQAAFSPVLGVVIKTDIGAPVFGIDNRMMGGFVFPADAALGAIRCRIEQLPLMPGCYSMDLYLGDRQRSLDRIIDAANFDVLQADVLGTGKLPGSQLGPVWCPARFEYMTTERRDAEVAQR